MSTTSKSNSNTADSANTITESEDLNLFQAARRTGRRNALGDLSEHLSKGNYFHFWTHWLSFWNSVELAMGSSSSSDVEKMAPHFQSMSIKN